MEHKVDKEVPVRREASVKRHRRRRISLRFEDVDMRTREATRMKEVIALLVAEFPGENPDTLRELGVHRLALEAAQAQAIAGMAKASERAVRHQNCIFRIERGLRKRKAAAPRPELSLAEYLRGYGAEAGDAG